jgi:energy-coupling factor transporter ATP-binding protein EcfA2
MARLSGRPLLDTRADAALFVDRRAELDRVDRAATEGLNVLVSGPRGIGKTSLLRHQAYGRRSTGREVAVLDASALTDPAAFLAAAADAVGVASQPGGQVSAADLVATLSRLAPADDTPLVLAVDGLAPAVAQAVFGQLRDELWRAPLTWLVSCADVDEPAFLRPPADAFFDTTVRLGALSDDDMHDLLRRRATAEELSDEALTEVVGLAAGVPRRAIDLARHLLLAPEKAAGASSSVEDVRDRLLDREQIVERLATPARMLLAELETVGGASASDERLLTRLGWTRARAAQVFGELERQGLVEATDEPRPSGRPRRVFHSKDWLTA